MQPHLSHMEPRSSRAIAAPVYIHPPYEPPSPDLQPLPETPPIEAHLQAMAHMLAEPLGFLFTVKQYWLWDLVQWAALFASILAKHHAMKTGPDIIDAGLMHLMWLHVQVA